MPEKIIIGLDIGSVSINSIVIDKNLNIVGEKYSHCHGKPFHLLHQVLSEIVASYGAENIKGISLTGSGGKLAANLIGGVYVNEIIAQSTSVSVLYPNVKSIIELGGEDSKLILMDQANGDEYSHLSDFAMNTLCAAGTGSFLDQQAKRIGVSIENEFGELALKSENPPRIAGRCSVFAKSDMIHLQQIATPVHDIVAGLCFAVARNFKSNLAKGKELQKPVVFQGGVAANKGMIKAFSEVFNLKDGELIIPEHHASMGAIGAAYYMLRHNEVQAPEFKGLKDLENYLIEKTTERNSLEPLKISDNSYNTIVTPVKGNGKKTEVFLGIDVGSLSTNVVLIDKDNNLIARRYLPTASKPLNAVQTGLSEIFGEVGEKVIVKGVGTTGSGRYLTGDFVGADAIRNEITAQATAALAHDPTVDTIFEIGGQDSKYISLSNGVVVDFEMNKVCAAGTGSFIEEQAEKLDVNIKEEFSDIAFQGRNPVPLGCRCTVFIESDLNSHQQKGAKKDNLISGLAYSIVNNYLQKVVGDKPVGNKIFFQGGVTNNKAVVAAFEQVLGKKIIVPPHFDVTGAIGAAILARNAMVSGQASKFRGFDISKVKFQLSKFTCKSCTNLCEIRSVKVDGLKKPLFYGGRCEKYEVEERKQGADNFINLSHERLKLLLGDYIEEKKSNGKISLNYKVQEKNGRITIGIPQGLTIFYQTFPFWRTFFNELGFHVVVSGETSKPLISRSLEVLATETCYPVEVMHGHVEKLLDDKDVDYVFAPFVVNEKAGDNNPTNNCNCPWIQTYPFMMRTALGRKKTSKKLLVPTLHFRYFDRVLKKELSKFMKEKFGIKTSKTKKAIDQADMAQTDFDRAIQAKGQEILNNIPKGLKPVVILGRQYNINDPALNLELIDKLSNLNVFPIPIDFLPLENEDIFKDYNSMYWPNGRRILAASRIVSRSPDLHAIYMGNFRCGPDSFLSHFVREEMKGKPYLQLELDEHSADAGLITRVEAFLDSLKGHDAIAGIDSAVFRPGRMVAAPLKDRVLYFPYMNDSAHAVSAATRSCGLKSEVLPPLDEEALDIGRKYTSSKECFPFICTTGAFLKKLMEPGVDPTKVSFFMPDHNGPCRFGQYNKLQRVIFDRLGYKDVQIVSPSNENSYEDISGGHNMKFTYVAWKGLVAIDILRKFLQERRPYEAIPGKTQKIYDRWLNNVIVSVENGAKGLDKVLEEAKKEFQNIPLVNSTRKPLIVIVGEIFMRDNKFASANLIDRLEKLGAETIIAPFSEWLVYSTYRFKRDSKWKGNMKGVVQANIKKFTQNYSADKLKKVVKDSIELDKDVHLEHVLSACSPYVHKHYDGDPALAFGFASCLTEKKISGVVNILPFTCMPGALIQSGAEIFRKDHDNIPFESIAYDGQEDTNMNTRLQAFVHQAKEFAGMKGYDIGRIWEKKSETVES